MFHTATGLFTNSPLPTTQSNAFLSVPGTPCAYSGLHITTAAAEFSCLSRCRIQLFAKSRHCDGTRACIQVRIEVRKTVQPVRERNDGPVWRDARSKPQELGIE